MLSLKLSITAQHEQQNIAVSPETSERSSRFLTTFEQTTSTSTPFQSTLPWVLNYQKSKMNRLTITFCFVICVHDSAAIDIMPELKRNILNFGYGVNFKCKGMLSHSFDRFYVVATFEKPSMEDIRPTTVKFDSRCSYLVTNSSASSSYYAKLLKYYLKIVPNVKFYNKQIEYINCTAYNILTNEIEQILPTFPTDKRPKRGVILASVLGGIASSVIGLAYEGISSFLHHKRHNALHKSVNVMERKTNLPHNQIYHLEYTMIMYGVYNSDTWTELIDTVHQMHNGI